MGVSIYNTPLNDQLKTEYLDFLRSAGLRDEGDADIIALMTDDEGTIAATGALAGNTIKQLAVAPKAEGQGLMAELLSSIIGEAADRGIFRLFLCTKPDNRRMFASMGFYPVVEISDAVLMENRRDGAERFLASFPRHEGLCGAVVCNCDPFTLGHRHLIEYAAGHCDSLYVFAVSERGSFFTPEERLEMIRRGTEDIANCYVYESDLYLISRATFPAYFIKDTAHAEEVKADLDIEFFAGRIAPALGITARFVGEEPLDEVTRAYNERMKELLPQRGIRLEEIPRLKTGEGNDAEAVSASRVRALIKEGKTESIRELVPETTYEIISRKFN